MVQFPLNLKSLKMENKRIDATHFALLYNVPCMNLGTRERRIDHCCSGIREMQYLAKLEKCSASENVAVFKIKWKVIQNRPNE